MRHRYPFEALHWLREQKVDRKASALAESVQRAARARSDASRAEAQRRGSEQELLGVSAVEQARLGEGLMRAGDLKVADDWQKAAAAELAAKAERERQACEVRALEAAAESRARQALAAAKTDAQLIDAHRDGFRAQRAKVEELSEEEAAAEQWTASHFSLRRS